MTTGYGKIKYFGSIPASPNKERILSRLGYRKGITELGDDDIVMIQKAIQLGADLCKPAGAYLELPVFRHDVNGVILAGEISLQGQGLARLLENSNTVVLMASTVGSGVVERIHREVENGNAAAGLILDSVASQTADAVLDWLTGFLEHLLAREGKKLTKHRYSPGFGDLPLACQKPIFEALQLEKLQVSLTERFMLTPEKSVIAIAGVEEKEN
jgi:hypothetical protein